MQIFVTTHSTSFVDSVSFQNIYLVARDSAQRTVCQTLDAGDGVLKIPAELGLRLSTVFMYDRLVFVEGPSDEAVLRELAKILDYDLAKANVGFVQMGGVRNFAHFAAQATLELLTRRNIRSGSLQTGTSGMMRMLCRCSSGWWSRHLKGPRP